MKQFRDCLNMFKYDTSMIRMGISADPGLRQGRGGAWDHRRRGTFPS